jgi:predicted dehydrogenase
MASYLSRRELLKAGSAGIALGIVSKLHADTVAEKPKPIRCAFVGVGGRGSKLLRDVLKFEDVEVVSICDTTPANLDKALAAVEETRGKRPAALGKGPWAYRELLVDEAIDCVVFATPCNWHSTMYVDALKAEKHFYAEKPLAITTTELKWVNNTHRQHKDVIVQVGFQWMSHKGRADIISRIRKGDIGELVEGRFHRYNGLRSLDGWFNKRALSGDWMLEQAAHEFNLLWWATGKHPLSAYTVGRTGIIEPGNVERDVTDYYATILEYPDGLIVHYSHDWLSPPGFSGMSTRLIGTKGGADILGSFLQLHGKEEKEPGSGPAGDTAEHLRNFFDAVRAKDLQMVSATIENGTAASYVGLLIRKSLDEKRKVTFEEMLADEPDLPAIG